MGRELNPIIGSLDLKSFCELRPGLIGWLVINISMACEQATRNSGAITDSMLLLCLFQGWYVVDALYLEVSAVGYSRSFRRKLRKEYASDLWLVQPAILTQMDITTDGFGYMLNMGDLSWVPFIYSLQTRYLAFNPVVLGTLRSTALVIANCVGYYIFRASNNEKDEFRKGRNPKSEH